MIIYIDLACEEKTGLKAFVDNLLNKHYVRFISKPCPGMNLFAHVRHRYDSTHLVVTNRVCILKGDMALSIDPTMLKGFEGDKVLLTTRENRGYPHYEDGIMRVHSYADVLTIIDQINRADEVRSFRLRP